MSRSALEQLLARVSRYLTVRGEKSALARFLGVGPQAITKYLNGASAPSAEVALRMLEWVEWKEREQKKSPAGASTPARPKTRPKQSSDEKPRSSRKKK